MYHRLTFCWATSLALLLGGSVSLCAQEKILYVDPGQTDPAIATVHGPNLALYDPQATNHHRLFFFIGGTGSNATNSLAMERVVARWGCHAISIDYENGVQTASLGHSTDPAVFDRYRQAIVTGAPVSDRIKVDPANSILNRFQKLLAYLVEHDPQGGWDEFVKDGQPAWKQIIVAGHSQGSGHAAYIGKLFNVDRVLIFSGPQDYLDDLHEPAPWQAGASATPPSHYFAFLSQNDPFNLSHQETNCMTLMHLSKVETLAVTPATTIAGDWQILVNNVPKKQAHGSTISPRYTNAWAYMINKGL